MRTAWNKGMKVDRAIYPSMGHFSKHSRATREKLVKNHKGTSGLSFSDTHKRKIKDAQKNKPHLDRRGSSHWNWKGGVTGENKKVRNTIEYRLWREAVFARDNWTCQKTGKRGVAIHPHHIQNFAEYPELRFAIDNGVTLSEKAHKEFHKKYGRSNNTKEQIVEFLSYD